MVLQQRYELPDGTCRVPGPYGRHDLGLGQDPIREHQRVGSQVVHGPAALARVHCPVVIHQILSHIHGDGLDASQKAGLQDLSHHVEPGECERPQCLHAEQSFVAGQTDQFLCGGDSGGHGFLDEHVMACLQGQTCVGGVIQVACRDIDDIDVLGH